MSRDPLIGRQLANYHIERLLGRGGMAAVYFGQDVKLKRPVAIKVIEERYQGRSTYAERFIQEAQAVARWRHENIIQVYYADDKDGLSYFAMEYIDGPNLADILERYAARGELLPLEDVVRIGTGIAKALDYAHSHGIIHRDVKPSNVFIERSGRVVLGDFGLALDVQQGSWGEIFGTAHYMAPEQARRSNEAIPQSDLYSLGVILFEMLTGSVPFDDISPTSVALQHLTEPPPSPRQINPDLNEAVEAVLLKALSKSPADRYSSGAELIEALKNALEASHPPTVPLSELPPLPVEVQSLQAANRRTLSRVSIFEYSQQASPTVPTSVGKARQKANTPAPPHDKASVLPAAVSPARSWLWAGLLAGGVILAIILFLAITRRSTPSLLTPTRPVSTTIVPSPVVTRFSMLFTPTNPPTSTPVVISATPVDTIAPTQPITATETPLASPTIKYPKGKRFTLLYNDSSFYILQETGGATTIVDIAFERLSDNGKPLNRFEGKLWSEYYSVLRPDTCMRLEILYRAQYLHPEQCKERYFSTRTPTWDSEWVFWTAQTGSQVFRVLWKDEEVGRCEIAKQQCQVFIP